MCMLSRTYRATSAGIYNAHILEQLLAHQLPTCGAARRLEGSLQIKQAGGLQRGKSDSIDAQRIAEYARRAAPYRFRDRMRLCRTAEAATTPLCASRTSHTQRFTAAVIVGSATVTGTG